MLANVFSFHGRRGRLSYLLISLLQTLVAIVLQIAVEVVLELEAGVASGEFPMVLPHGATPIILGLVALLTLLLIWSYLAVSVQRFHDFGSSGRWIWLTTIPLVSFIIYLVLLFKPGQKHANRYGPVPMPGSQAPAFVAQ